MSLPKKTQTVRERKTKSKHTTIELQFKEQRRKQRGFPYGCQCTPLTRRFPKWGHIKLPAKQKQNYTFLFISILILYLPFPLPLNEYHFGFDSPPAKLGKICSF